MHGLFSGMLAHELVLKIDGPNLEWQKSNLPPSRRPIVGRSEIPSYVLYGEPYGAVAAAVAAVVYASLWYGLALARTATDGR